VELIFKNQSMFNTNLFFNTGGTLTPAPNLYLRAEGANLNSRIYSSSDFTTWTARTGNLDTESRVAVNSFAYSPTLGITVAVCDNRFGVGSGSIFYSSNAISWTGTLSGAYRWQKVIWVSELSKFFAIDLAGELASSSNGISWSVGSAGSGVFGSITWSPELGLLAACRNSTSTTNVVTSPDGVTWTARNFPVGNMTCHAIQWCGGSIQKFIAVGTGRVSGAGTINSRWYSTDGITWISTLNTNGPYATGTAYSNTLGLVLYVTQNPDVSIYRSSDGINWSSIPTSLQFTDIVWVENKRRFIASGLNATSELGFSTDGINWTFSAASPSEDQSAIGFAGI
jgi:hypothetical protein